MKYYTLYLTLAALLLSSCDINTEKEILGNLLYHDVTLSENSSMSCATCHNDKSAYVDIRESMIGHMAAGSANGLFFGDRNVPTVAYAAYIPVFEKLTIDGKVIYQGGQFLDGRAKDLQAQAAGPFLNGKEMQMPNKKGVMQRIQKNAFYRYTLKKIYGVDIFNDDNASYDAMTNAIASYEQKEIFSPFDSKYDRALEGKYTFSDEEARGLALFGDTNRTKCSLCHPLLKEDKTAGMFTNYRYHNLGVPKNKALREINGMGDTYIDHGLLMNPEVNETIQDGKFRTSTLRNIANTAPYMHNGLFKELKTVIHFYNTRDVKGAINPETGKTWEVAEVPTTMNHSKLGNLGLSDAEENDIVAFMKTLSDKRYEK